MGGVHLATALALVSLVLTCLNVAAALLKNDSPFPALGYMCLVAAALLACISVLVFLHGRGRGPARISVLLDDWIGPPPNLSERFPDMTLLAVVRRLAPGPMSSSQDGSVSFQEGNHKKIAQALRTIREEALLGRIRTWGRLAGSRGREDARPRQEIPKEHWESFRVPYLDFLQYPRGETAKDNDSGEGRPYIDIYFNFAEINRRWPKAAERLRLRTPWHRVRVRE